MFILPRRLKVKNKYISLSALSYAILELNKNPIIMEGQFAQDFENLVDIHSKLITVEAFDIGIPAAWTEETKHGYPVYQNLKPSIKFNTESALWLLTDTFSMEELIDKCDAYLNKNFTLTKEVEYKFINNNPTNTTVIEVVGFGIIGTINVLLKDLTI